MGKGLPGIAGCRGGLTTQSTSRRTAHPDRPRPLPRSHDERRSRVHASGPCCLRTHSPGSRSTNGVRPRSLILSPHEDRRTESFVTGHSQCHGTLTTTQLTGRLLVAEVESRRTGQSPSAREYCPVGCRRGTMNFPNSRTRYETAGNEHDVQLAVEAGTRWPIQEWTPRSGQTYLFV